MRPLKLPKTLVGYVGFSMSSVDIDWLLRALETASRTHLHSEAQTAILNNWASEWMHAIHSAPKSTVSKAILSVQNGQHFIQITRRKGKRYDVICQYRALAGFDALFAEAQDWSQRDECMAFIRRELDITDEDGTMGYIRMKDAAGRVHNGFVEMREYLTTL